MNKAKQIALKAALAAVLCGLPASWPALPPVCAAAAQPASQTQTADSQKYSGYIWRLDAENKDKLPRTFRTANSPFLTGRDGKKTGKDFTAAPTRAGLDKLYASGSGQFSEKGLQALLPVLRRQAKGPIYIVDLRQETHGFFNGTAVSWYGKRDWGNIGKSRDAVLSDEQQRLQAVKGKSPVVAALDDDKNPIAPQPMKIDSALSEKELAQRYGLHYYRITATDHVWPSAEQVDSFIRFTKTLPENAWLHFHCEAGKGRTTAFLTMYDMMKNPDVPLGDILSRQYLLGGNYVAYEIKNPKPGQWKAPYYQEKARMIAAFYQYVQAARADGCSISWSSWLKKQGLTR